MEDGTETGRGGFALGGGCAASAREVVLTRGKPKHTNKTRIEVLKRWACDEKAGRREMGADLGVSATLVSSWIMAYLDSGQVLYRCHLRPRLVWEGANKRAVDDVLSTPDGYWSPPKPSSLADRIPKQAGSYSLLDGGILYAFGACTVDEMNQILCAIGTLE